MFSLIVEQICWHFFSIEMIPGPQIKSAGYEELQFSLETFC